MSAPGPGGILGRLRERGLLPRKQLGQHFLHDPGLLRRLVAEAGVAAGDWVFEVGTGPGCLTRALAEAAGGVLSIDVDPRMLEFAREELAGLENVELLQVDALEAGSRLARPLVPRLAVHPGFLWVSNLPYGVASPLIVAFLEENLPWRRASLLVQLEVGERLVAGVGGRDYGPLSLLVAYWANARLGRQIPPGAFWPAPQVESRVVALEPREPLGAPEEFSNYASWVRRLFQGRRKQVGGLLRRVLGPGRAAEALEVVGGDPRARPETLEPGVFLALARRFPGF